MEKPGKKYVVEAGGPEICLLGAATRKEKGKWKSRSSSTRTLRARVMVHHQEKCLLVPQRPPLVHLLEANFPLVIYRETILQFNAVASPRLSSLLLGRLDERGKWRLLSRTCYILAGTLMCRLFSAASKSEKSRASYLRYVTLVRERINLCD